MPDLNQDLARDYWHLVAHRSELAEPGDYVRFEWPLGELVIHNDHGRALAFDNVCPHRGGFFFSGDAGNGRAICPYHGWSVRDGEVRPSRRDLFEGCDMRRSRINAHQTQWWGDFLFVGVEPKQALADQLGGLGGEIADLSTDIGSRTDLHRIGFDSDWRVAVENALESYHVNFVHPDTLAALNLVNERDALAGPTSAYYADIGASRSAKGFKSLRRFFDIAHGFEGYCTYFVFPFAMISSTFGYSYAVQNFFPARSPGRTHFYTRLLAARSAVGAEAVTAPLMASTATANRQIFQEDAAICRRVSPDFDLDHPHRIYAASEQRIRHFVGNIAEARARVQGAPSRLATV